MRLLLPLCLVTGLALSACAAPPEQPVQPAATAASAEPPTVAVGEGGSLRLAVSAEGEPELAAAVARAVLRLDPAVTLASSGQPANALVRLRRVAPGDTFEVVTRRGRLPVVDAVRRLDCPPPAGISCAEPPLARLVVDLLAQ